MLDGVDFTNLNPDTNLTQHRRLAGVPTPVGKPATNGVKRPREEGAASFQGSCSSSCDRTTAIGSSIMNTHPTVWTKTCSTRAISLSVPLLVPVLGLLLLLLLLLQLLLLFPLLLLLLLLLRCYSHSYCYGCYCYCYRCGYRCCCSYSYSDVCCS